MVIPGTGVTETGRLVQAIDSDFRFAAQSCRFVSKTCSYC
jgi:hypothetical protein